MRLAPWERSGGCRPGSRRPGGAGAAGRAAGAGAARARALGGGGAGRPLRQSRPAGAVPGAGRRRRRRGELVQEVFVQRLARGRQAAAARRAEGLADPHGGLHRPRRPSAGGAAAAGWRSGPSCPSPQPWATPEVQEAASAVYRDLRAHARPTSGCRSPCACWRGCRWRRRPPPAGCRWRRCAAGWRGPSAASSSWPGNTRRWLPGAGGRGARASEETPERQESVGVAGPGAGRHGRAAGRTAPGDKASNVSWTTSSRGRRPRRCCAGAAAPAGSPARRRWRLVGLSAAGGACCGWRRCGCWCRCCPDEDPGQDQCPADTRGRRPAALRNRRRPHRGRRRP